MVRDNQVWTVQTLVKISALGVVSFVLMFFKMPVWFAPPFMKFDISDLPSLLGAFAMGPVTGIWVQLVKNLLNLLVEGSVTNGVGEFTNFLVGSVMAFVAGCVYKRNRTFKGALSGLGIGIIAMTVFATLNNYFVMFPLYARVLGLDLDTLVRMGSAVNKHVVDYKTLMLFAVVPFNLLKGTGASLAAVLVYKRLSPVLKQ
ncbi:MAG: ECF transporter S component [Bacillota bacterium]|jgi:riboflavin transporter FmnP|nr:ECF transporter S component [Candidatus Fermentithermobacillaceae bacterium]